MGSWRKSGQGLRGSSHRKRSGLFLTCCVCKHPYYCPCPAQTDVALGLSHLSVSRPSFHLGCGSLRPSVGPCCDASRVRGVSELRVGHVPCQSGETRRPLEELSLHPSHPVSGASMHIPYESVQFSSVPQSCLTLCNPMDYSILILAFLSLFS